MGGKDGGSGGLHVGIIRWESSGGTVEVPTLEHFLRANAGLGQTEMKVVQVSCWGSPGTQLQLGIRVYSADSNDSQAQIDSNNNSGWLRRSKIPRNRENKSPAAIALGYSPQLVFSFLVQTMRKQAKTANG